jgi:acetyl esterase/lipase
MTGSPDMPLERGPVRLWEGEAPGALGSAPADVPVLTPYLPGGKRESAAMVIFPGGGYEGLSPHEGRDYALYLAAHGIAGFVVQYRLGCDGYRHPRMWEDAARSIRLVRARAREWNINPARVGVMGSSAGGHLASAIMTRNDRGVAGAADPVERQSSRPDLGVLCYPVISMGKFAHEGSKRNLLGSAPAPERVGETSSETQVTPGTPPAFIWHTWDDEVVPVENALMFASSLREKGVPFDMHIYRSGPHGLGLGDAPPFARVHPWAGEMLYWLSGMEFLESGAE